MGARRGRSLTPRPPFRTLAERDPLRVANSSRPGLNPRARAAASGAAMSPKRARGLIVEGSNPGAPTKRRATCARSRSRKHHPRRLDRDARRLVRPSEPSGRGRFSAPWGLGNCLRGPTRVRASPAAVATPAAHRASGRDHRCARPRVWPALEQRRATLTACPASPRSLGRTSRPVASDRT
jgi:hypothetical protein